MKKTRIKSIYELTAADLPPQLRPIYNKAPKNIRMLLVTVAIVCWMTLGTRLRVAYCFDKFSHMLVVNLLVIGPSGAGKSIVRWLVSMLLAPLKKKDTEERRREQEYNDERNRKSKNKDLEREPLCIARYCQSVTVPKLVKRADFMVRRYGAPLTFFLFTDELASMCSGSRANRDEYNAIARTAYQEGEEYIRETLYQEGYNAAVDINWCSILCGQDYALDKYIDKAGILLGDAGRQILFRLDTFGDEAVTMKPFTPEEQQMLESTSQRLMDETYLEGDKLAPVHKVDMHWLDKDVHEWCHEQTMQITKNGSRAQDSFFKRASSGSFRLCTMMYYLWGETPSAQKHVRRCYYAYAQWILDGLMQQWGKRYEQLLPAAEEVQAARPSLYEQMPKTFTREMLREMIQKLEIATPARIFIFKWLKKKLIFKVEGQEDVYEKKF